MEYEFPAFVISCEKSLAEVVPEKPENRREFARSATMLELQYLLSRRADLELPVMMERMIKEHERLVLDAVSGSAQAVVGKIEGLENTISNLPRLDEIENKVRDKLRELKREGIVDHSSLAEGIRKELNSKYNLNWICKTLERDYGGDGRIAKIIQEISSLVKTSGDIEEALGKMPDENRVARAVAESEKSRFESIGEKLENLRGLVEEVHRETIRKSEKAMAIIEAEEQEFEKEAMSFVHEWYNGHYSIEDVRNRKGCISRKTGDVVMDRFGAHDYRITIDWKKRAESIDISEARDVAENALQNREADASIVCAQSPEQLPPEVNGIHLFDSRKVLTHFGFVRLAIELVETFVELEEGREAERDVNIKRVSDVVARIESGNEALEKTIESLNQAKNRLEKSVSRLISYQQNIANAAIRELRVITGPRKADQQRGGGDV